MLREALRVKEKEGVKMALEKTQRGSLKMEVIEKETERGQLTPVTTGTGARQMV
jgi:hypothetical protein